VYFFDSTGDLLWRYATGDEVWDVSISADGNYIAVGSKDYTVYFFDSSGSLLGEYKADYYVSAVSTSVDGDFTAAGSYDNNVYFFKKIQPAVEKPKFPKLDVTRSITKSHLVEGDDTTVIITLQNIGEAKAKSIRFADSVPGAIEVIEGKTEWKGELESGESITVLYKIKALELGKLEDSTYQLPGLDVTYEDSQGAIYHAKSAPISIVVSPKPVQPVQPPTRLLTLLYSVLFVVIGAISVTGIVFMRRRAGKVVYRRETVNLVKRLKGGVEVTGEQKLIKGIRVVARHPPKVLYLLYPFLSFMHAIKSLRMISGKKAYRQETVDLLRQIKREVED
jgi:hypothetical protein